MELFCKSSKGLISQNGSISENWHKFKQNFDIFLEETDNIEKPDEIKVAILLYIVGKDGIELYNTFNLQEAERNNFAKVLQCFEEYCIPKINTVHETFKFFSRIQQEDEKFESFLTEIKKLSQMCEFGIMTERMIRDRIVLGIRDKALQERLLRIEDLNLQNAIDYCKAAEVSEVQVRKTRGDKIRRDGLRRKVTQKFDCTRCNTKHSLYLGECPAYKEKRKKRGKINHSSKTCTIEVDEKSAPVTCHSRRIPYTVRDKLKVFWKAPEEAGSGSDYKSGTENSLKEKLHRCRMKFTDDKRNELMRVFEETPRPDKKKKEELAQKIGLPINKIHIWFQNRRFNLKYRKFNLKTNRKYILKKQEKEKSNGKNKTEAERKNNSKFNDDQRNELMQMFEKNPVPDTEQKENIAQRMGLPVVLIHRWFRKRRYIEKQISLSTCDHEKVNSGSDRKNETKKKCRKLMRFTDDQKHELVQFFKKDRYPTKKAMKELGKRIGAPIRNISVWFQNTRRVIKLKEPAYLSKEKSDTESDYEIKSESKIVRSRTKFTDDQRNKLLQVFEKNQYPSKRRMEKLAWRFGVPSYSIHWWFLNTRRARLNKFMSSTQDDDDNRGRIFFFCLEHQYLILALVITIKVL